MRQKILCGFLLITLGLQGCVSKPPVVSLADVRQALSAAQPDQDYERLAARITPAIHGKRRQLSQKNLQILGHDLAQHLEDRLSHELALHTLSSGLVPLPILDAAQRKASALHRYDVVIANHVDEQLDQQRQRTQSRIDRLQNLRATLDSNAYLQRYKVLSELMDLTDDAGFSRERSDLVASLQDQAHSAIEHRNDAAAIAALQPLSQIDTHNDEFRHQLNAAQARLFNHQFWGEINAGQLQNAYDKFEMAAKMPDFKSFAALLPQGGAEMVSYFLAQANAALSAQRADSAYENLHRARNMRLWAGLDSGTLPEEKNFADRMMERYSLASRSGQHGQALGLLLAIDEFMPQYPNLHALEHQEHTQVLSHAQRTLSVPTFSSQPGQEAMGAALSIRIAQELFHRIPHDVRIIDHDQFMALLKGSNSGDHRPVDSVIEGKLLQAHIDTSEENGEKTLRVTTDSSEQPNPAYSKWQQLSSREQKKTPQPAATITIKQEQTVTIKMSRVRKIGTATASYRLIDARNNKIIDTQSPSFSVDVEDTGNEGMELGQFHLPFKLPSLPSDAEIDDKLTEGLAQAIVDKLLPELGDSEIRDQKKAEHAASYGDMSSASRYAAYAYVLSQAKGKSTQELRLRLCTLATRASNATTAASAPGATPQP